MKIQQTIKLNSFADRHRLFCFVVSFCLGLVTCVSIAKLEAKQNTHQQLVSPSEFNADSETAETGDDSEIQRTQHNGNSNSFGKHVGQDQAKPCKTLSTLGFQASIRQSLTSLGIRLQI